LGKFLPNLSDVKAPLRNLLKQDAPWTWLEIQETAVKKLKEMIISPPVLAFYDPSKELVLQNDACEYD